MTRRRPLHLFLATLLLVLSLLTVRPVPVASAATLSFTVTSTTDAHDVTPGDGLCADAGGHCTLRAATEEANASPAGSTINITVPAGHYLLTLGELDLISNTIVLSGTGPSQTIVDAGNASRIVQVFSHAIVGLALMTLTKGKVSGGNGGGVLNAGYLVLVGTVLSNNTAGGDGGGLHNAGMVTLRQSVVLSNTASSGGGLANTGTMTLTSTAIVSNTANGFGGGGIFNYGTMTLTSTAIVSNAATFAGGGIANNGTMTLTSTAIVSNTAGNCGGIFNYGTMTLTSSAIVSNTATYGGGGFGNGRTMTLTSTTIVSNTATNGGGILNDGTTTLTNSTVSGNVASAGQGGGIYTYTGTVTLVNSTVSGNVAPTGQGGGIYDENSVITLSYVTVAANSDGIVNTSFSPGTVALTGTIVANSTAGPNCTGIITEGHGDNLDSGTSCGFTQTTDISGTNPLLGPLANNGGPTLIHALLADSPAIDHGGTAATGCAATDQRGLPRPDTAAEQGACDIGAYESQGVN